MPGATWGMHTASPFASPQGSPVRGPPPPPPSTHLPFSRDNTHPSLGRSIKNGKDETLSRKKSLVKPERAKSLNRPAPRDAEHGNQQTTSPYSRTHMRNQTAAATMARRGHTLKRLATNPDQGPPVTWWTIVSRILTFFLPTPFLRTCGKTDPYIQQAFREKIALFIIIFFIMACVCFLVFGFNAIVCAKMPKRVPYSEMKNQHLFNIRGVAYRQPDTLGKDWEWDHLHGAFIDKNLEYIKGDDVEGLDLNRVFPLQGADSVCERLPEVNGSIISIWPCSVPGLWPRAGQQANIACHTAVLGTSTRKLVASLRSAELFMLFEEVAKNPNLVAYNGQVWNVQGLLTGRANFLGADIAAVIRANLGKDITRAITTLPNGRRRAACLNELFRVAAVDSDPVGCIVYNIVFYVSFAVVFGILSVRFVLAVFFGYVIGWRNGAREDGTRMKRDLERRRTEFASMGRGKRTAPGSEGNPDRDGESQMEIRLEHVSSEKKLGGSASNVIVNRKIAGNTPPPSPRGLPQVARSPSSLSKSSSHSKAPATPQHGPVLMPDGQMREPTLPSIHLTDLDMSPRPPSPPSASGSEIDWANNRYLDPAFAAAYVNADPVLNDPTLLHTLVMVPAYSESASSLRATLDSVAHSYYPSTHKTLFVIADGIVQGAENDRPTPDMLIDMMEVDERFKEDDPKWGGEPNAYSYVAIADGSKRKNFARVYAGWYRYALKDGDQKKKKGMFGFGGGNDDDDEVKPKDDNNLGGAPGLQRSMTMRTIRNRKEGKIPMILVVKCGNEEERDPNSRTAKPGNRGKRDSQVLLMQFLTKVMFDDRMTELEFDIFHKLWTITGLHPERYEAVLMVDADTRIYPDAITHMVACMIRDPRVFGLCGETKVYNKWASWVTMIQVFEYYISHHLSKAFESVFGGVTCLPGCFSMYRIKAPKGDLGYYVPLLANPDVCEEYSEYVVDTLHKKNLLLLGEDRYLTTLMLRTFPKRRSVFVPQAICKTVVPDGFRVLLSQRRRWINSTLHNLLELVLVRDLCGTFCISMQVRLNGHFD
ncbi:hypothetical protein HK097_008212 [Rhizophlyctis rosea]|uniref:chitin synthase n=1 Tax=Rhizophlyctis rosea TaxID=64517 RepID=A0AAD5SJN9_9FUNG|nr:hypothetical protein HK097_008212 [Rhizophlyctis rosea]